MSEFKRNYPQYISLLEANSEIKDCLLPLSEAEWDRLPKAVLEQAQELATKIEDLVFELSFLVEDTLEGEVDYVDLDEATRSVPDHYKDSA